MSGMWFPVAMFTGFIAWMVSRGNSAPKVGPIVLTPATESYRIWCMPLSIATGVPIEFALAWIQKESGGNPCAWGNATAKGPDGHPREQGLAQLYNPDDMKKFGIPSGAFRVYCVPGTQKCSRALTPVEIASQVKALYQLIQKSRETADEAMRKNGIAWKGRDYWRAVKLVHALPGLVKQGFARTTVSLQRPPKDWYEFVAAVARTKMDAGTEAYRASFPRLLANAESVGGSAPGQETGNV